MRPFGFFILIYLVYLFVQKKEIQQKYLDFMVFSLSVGLYIQIGYFFAKGSFDISYSFFLEILLFLWCIYKIILGLPLSRRNLCGVVLLTIVLLINIGLMKIYPYRKPMLAYGVSPDFYVLGNATKVIATFSFSNILSALKILMMAVIILVMRRLSHKEIQYVLCRLSEIGKMYLVYCTVEFLLKNIFRSEILYKIQALIFGVVGATQAEIRSRGRLYTLQGLTKEPSHLALQLLIIIVVLVYQRKVTQQKNTFWIGLGVFYIVTGMSLTSFLCLFSLACFYYLAQEGTRSKLYITMGVILLSAMASIIIFISLEGFINSSYYAKRIWNVLSDLPSILNGSWMYTSNSEISNRARMVSLIEGIKVLWDRPLLGTGVGTSGCMSDIIAFAGNAGIIGLYAWLKAVPFGEKIRNKKYKWALLICVFPQFFVNSENIFWTLSALVLYITLSNVFSDTEKVWDHKHVENKYYCTSI